MLSHRNMLANVAQAAARIDFGREDKLFNVLPVFHSFGLTGGIVLPLVSGVPIYLYPSPLHYRTVPELVYGVCATVLFGTDTFLNGYARVANPYDFRSLRYVVAGAEPVKESTRQIYLEKFGLRILEGYGVTETAPVLALNTPMFNKFGTVGRLLPGMEAQAGEGRGRRRGRPALRQRAERDARLSARRQSRRARAAARRLARHRRHRRHRRAGLHRHQGPRQALRQGRRRDDFARRGRDAGRRAVAEQRHRRVSPVPDARKGERLVLVTDKHGATRSDFQAYARSKHASELMMPAEIIVLDKMPLLGSGKVDQLAVAEIRAASRPRRSARRRSKLLPAAP